MRVFTVLYGIGTINVKNAEDTIFGIFKALFRKIEHAMGIRQG